MGTATGKVTLAMVRELRPGDEVRDSDLKGFGVRRQADTISYFVHTRINGRLKRMTIGRHGSPWTPETARRQAAALLLSIRSGGNPLRERDEQRQQSVSFDEVAERFLEIHGARLKPRTLEEYRRIVRGPLRNVFGCRPLSAIDTIAVQRAHAGWKATPRSANFNLAVLSKLWSWAQEQGLAGERTNPCEVVKRYRETKRERFLSDTELQSLGAALTTAERRGENPFVIAVIRMLILTGARLSEMLTLRWDYVDHEHSRLRLPDSKTGAKTIWLNEPAKEVLTNLPRLARSAWVFPGHVTGRHLVNIQKPWRSIRKAAGLPDVRLHDLRHSFASVAVGMGSSLPLIGHLLGHSQAQTTARYAHVAPAPAQRVAEVTGQRIAEVMGRADRRPEGTKDIRRRLKRRSLPRRLIEDR